jgi:hypothetical protein
MLARRQIVRLLASAVLVVTWSCATLWAADPMSTLPGEGTPPLSAYQLETAATALADALRLSRLARGAGPPVRLRYPEWRNDTDTEFRDAEGTVQRLCDQINRRSGAAVAFVPDSSVAREVWGRRDLRLLPTRLTLERTASGGPAELVLDILEPTGVTRIVEIRHVIRLSRQTDGRDAARHFGGRVSGVPGTGEEEIDREATVDKPPVEAPAGADAGDAARVRPTRPAVTIRQCRLPHPRAMPVDEEVERETELVCGRLLFLDRKSADRLVLLSAECQRQDDGTLIIVLELACRRRQRDVEVWAEFFGSRGRGVNRTRAKDYGFREGQIRVITLWSGLPAEQVVVFIKKD